MKPKLIKHKWIPVEGHFKIAECEHCGIVRVWVSLLGKYSYYKQWANSGPAGHLGYTTPRCKLTMNGTKN